MSSKDQEILGFWSEFFVSHALSVRTLEKRVQGTAVLGLDEYDVLLCIFRHPGRRIRFSSLAEATIYTRSGITRIIKRLEEQGLVQREVCPEDKRGLYAVLSDAGRQALDRSWKTYSAEVLKIMNPCFTQAEARQLRLLLGRLVESLTPEALVRIRARAVSQLPMSNK